MIATRSKTSLLAFVLVCASANARAADSPDTRDAAQLFRAGQAAYDHGDHEAAARAFEEAYRRAPRAAAAYNAGRAWQAAHSPARAADAYALALRDDASASDLRPEQRVHAQSSLEALRREVAEITVSEPSGARLDVGPVEARTIPATIYLPPGRHTLRVSSGEGEAFHEVVVTAGERRALTFPSVVAPAPPPVAAPDLAVRAVTPPPPPVSSGVRDPWAWITGGVAVAAGAGAAVLGLRFLDSKNNFEDSGFTDRGAHDDAIRLRAATNAAIGTAVIFAAISTWRFLRHPAPALQTWTASAPGALVGGSF